MEANELKTVYFLNTGSKFQLKELPLEAQFSPVFAIASLDYDKDGKQDLLLGGNISQGRLRLGKYDANYGLLLKGDGQGNFTTIPQKQSGFRLTGDVRSILPVANKLLFGINQKQIDAYQLK